MKISSAVKLLLVLCAGMLSVMRPPSLAAGTLLIADFDSGNPQNTLGGAFNVWGKDPDDASQWCRMSFDDNEKEGDAGRSLRLEYSVDSEREAYNGLWMKLNDLDLSRMKYLVFSIKGDAGAGFPGCVTVELKTKNKTGVVHVPGITDRWRRVVIPLEKFRDIRDRSKVSELTVVFVDELSSSKKGCVFLDNILVTDEAPPWAGEAPPAVCLITNFDDRVKVNERGGRFDVWSREAGGMTDPKQYCHISFDPAIRRGKTGCSLKIVYALGTAKSSCDGLWMQLGDLDASSYRYLVFFVKGDKTLGYTRRMRVELKGAAGTGSCVVEGIRSGWKRVAIPLRAFRGINDFKNLREFVIIFDVETVTKPAGVIYIDNVMFLKSLGTDEREGS